jgi:hypothetical protein
VARAIKPSVREQYNEPDSAALEGMSRYAHVVRADFGRTHRLDRPNLINELAKAREGGATTNRIEGTV